MITRLMIAAGALSMLAACASRETSTVGGSSSADAGAAMAAASAPNIVETAVAAGSFETLVAALQAADLDGTLAGPGPFTVFAPTDAAFAALPDGTVETLLLPENRDDLVAVLTYHVVPGQVMSSDLAGQRLEATTVQGSTVSIDATDGVMVDNATVIAADITASNGVIHVIDQVILP